MIWPQAQLAARRLPILIPGLFIGRLLSELLPRALGTATPHILALLITVSTTAISMWLLRRIPFSTSWPLLALLVYVAYPDPAPTVAITAVCASLCIWLIIPTRPSINPWVGALLSTAVLWLLYLNTVAPGVLTADNGEFQVVAANVGVAHPPGFPLYTMLGNLAIHLQAPADPALALNLFSAFTSCLTLIVVYLTVHMLTQTQWAALTAVVALGTATTFWAQATTANIRSLTALFAALMLATLTAYHCARQQNHPHAHRWLVGFGLAFGFGITHHASLIFMGLICLLFILITNPDIIKTPRRWLLPMAAGSLGLLPLLYLPLRATSGARGASPSLATWSGFWEHVLATGFRGDLFYFREPALLLERLRIMGNVLTFQFHPLLLIGMGIGLLLLVWQHRRMALLLAGTFLLHTLVTATYRAPQTVEYMLPAYVPAVILLGYGVGNFQLPRLPVRKVTAVFTTLLLLTAIWQGISRYPSFAWLHEDTSTRDQMTQLLTTAPANAVILAHWHWATPLWYLQEIDGIRPDITVSYVAPTGEPYSETWARRIREELAAGRDVFATHFQADTFANLPPAEPIGNAFWFRQTPRTALPPGFVPLNTAFAGSMTIVGADTAVSPLPTGSETIITVAWQPLAADTTEAQPLFVHMIDENGRLIAQDDLTVQPQISGITLTQFRLTPRPGNHGPARLLLGTPASEERLPLGQVDVVPSIWPAVTGHPHYLPTTENWQTRLVGYDWDTTLAGQTRLYVHWASPAGHYTTVYDDPAQLGQQPQTFLGAWGVARPIDQLLTAPAGHYVPLGQGLVWRGEPITAVTNPIMPNQPYTLVQQLSSRQPLLSDLVISVRLIGYADDGFLWAWWDLADGIPAMGGIPTLKWIAGTAVRDPHFVTTSVETQPGQTLGGAVTVYDAFTNRRLPILDERILAAYQWIPLGTTTAVP